jgi:threonine dehydrogenase-like Zn-dependent dehydrogenase
MKALVWRGQEDVRVENVPDPKLINPHDAILRVTSTAICGSDLHLYGGWMPTMESGDVLGHEFMGEVVETGPAVTNVKRGDRVLVPFCIACGQCFFCKRQMTSLCDNSNPNFRVAEKMFGYPTGGLFGYSHMTGGYAGGQAEYVRVPFANFGAFKVPEGMPDEKVLFLTDIFPTGYMAAENCDVKPGDVVAVFGCGPVGQFAIKSALLLGAERVIAIDRVPERLRMAQDKAGAADVINYEQADVMDELHVRTGGRGPDAVIDAVGLEAHGTDIGGVYDKVKAALRMATDRPNVLRMAILACRKGGTVSVPGVYGGFLDKIPFGALINKGLTIKTGQTHVHRYVKPLMERIQKGEIDPSFVITHRLTLDRAPEAYATFREKQENCIKVVLKP